MVDNVVVVIHRGDGFRMWFIWGDIDEVAWLL